METSEPISKTLGSKDKAVFPDEMLELAKINKGEFKKTVKELVKQKIEGRLLKDVFTN